MDKELLYNITLKNKLYIYHIMRRFVILFILLIGMISLTGFGTTTDLEKNSFAVSIDVDVGDVALVAQTVSLEIITFTATHFKTQALEVPYFLITYDQKPCYKQDIYNQPDTRQLERPPINSFLITTYYRSYNSDC